MFSFHQKGSSANLTIFKIFLVINIHCESVLIQWSYYRFWESVALEQQLCKVIVTFWHLGGKQKTMTLDYEVTRVSGSCLKWVFDYVF